MRNLITLKQRFGLNDKHITLLIQILHKEQTEGRFYSFEDLKSFAKQVNFIPVFTEEVTLEKLIEVAEELCDLGLMQLYEPYMNVCYLVLHDIVYN
ncbi:hypothetical protein [Bacillus luti]|uniref:Uncharacterized protein n=1 Tax=Bacillus luti TaxID=2026191 RepID=A0A7V7V6A5_9BACI|nr:hypothetical protein [Bacillus luti]KAB2443274.1 hypothetical protein F8163_09330 [Bacillus luti]